MLATKEEIIQAAKALPMVERMDVLDQIWLSLGPEPAEALSDEDLSLELDRRWNEYVAGRMKAAPANEVLERLRAKNRAHVPPDRQ
jgi:putative addiction module component (TIGR02574 family)